MNLTFTFFDGNGHEETYFDYDQNNVETYDKENADCETGLILFIKECKEKLISDNDLTCSSNDIKFSVELYQTGYDIEQLNMNEEKFIYYLVELLDLDCDEELFKIANENTNNPIEIIQSENYIIISDVEDYILDYFGLSYKDNRANVLLNCIDKEAFMQEVFSNAIEYKDGYIKFS